MLPWKTKQLNAAATGSCIRATCTGADASAKGPRRRRRSADACFLRFFQPNSWKKNLLHMGAHFGFGLKWAEILWWSGGSRRLPEEVDSSYLCRRTDQAVSSLKASNTPRSLSLSITHTRTCAYTHTESILFMSVCPQGRTPCACLV